MPAADPILHYKIFSWICSTSRAFYFMGSLSNVTVISFNPFIWIKPMGKSQTKNVYIWILTSCIRSFNPCNISTYYINSNLLSQSALPFEFMRSKKVSRDCRTLLRNPNINSIHTHEAVIQTTTNFPIFKYDLKNMMR